MPGAERLRPSRGDGEKNKISRRNVGDGDPDGRFPGNGKASVRQRRTSPLRQIKLENAVIAALLLSGDLPCRRKFTAMALTVVETQRVDAEPPADRDGQTGRGIRAAAQQNDGIFLKIIHSRFS